MYYYIVASLPYLTFSGTTETDIDGYLQFVESMLSEKDYAVLQAVYTGSGPAHSFVAMAQEFEQALAGELARNRAAALGRDPNIYPHASSQRVAEKARQLASLDDAYEAEMGLLSFNWEFLDDLESGHYFDLEKLVVHLMKLVLLERKNKLTEERGTARYAETYENITKPLENADVGV